MRISTSAVVQTKAQLGHNHDYNSSTAFQIADMFSGRSEPSAMLLRHMSRTDEYREHY